MNAMKNKKIWLCWNYFKADGRVTKKPVSAFGGATGTDVAHAGTLATYEDAVEAARREGHDGVGFVIPNGYFFIDIDHRDVSDPLVQSLLKRFSTTYVEKSVSGEGIHIYGMCNPAKVPVCLDENGKAKLSSNFYTKNPHSGIEMYIGGLTNRYAVYTGDVIQNKPLSDCTDGLLQSLDELMRKDNVPVVGEGERDTEDTEEDIEDIIRALHAQKNGAKFSRLYDNGDISGYNSPSEADVALCAIIAFRAGPNSRLIDQIFRGSALYRDKWEREDYRASTINAGINVCGGCFYEKKKKQKKQKKAAKKKANNPEFIITNEDGKRYVNTALLAKYARATLQYILVRDNAKQGLLIYVYKDGVYRLYSEDMFRGLIKQIIADVDEGLVKMSKVKEACEILCTDLEYVTQDELNANENLINFKNGLLRVTADGFKLLPHTPEVLSTVQLPCDWPTGPIATPVFDEFIKTLTNGDKAVERLLLQFMGVALSNVKGWRLKKALFLEGPGDSGKSQYKSLLERILGKGNYMGIDLKEIEARFGTGVIYGTRLSGSSDMTNVTIKEIKTFKKLTGGDSVFAEYKGKQGFEFTYSGILCFCVNKLPRFGGDDGKWVFERIMVVNCKNVIPLEKQDKQLLDKMFAERAGIIYKAVLALQQVLANGCRFDEPESVKCAREGYRAENSLFITFWKECMCELDDKTSVDLGWNVDRVYRLFKIWCEDHNNGFSKSFVDFRKELAAYFDRDYSELTTSRDGRSYIKGYGPNARIKSDSMYKHIRD